MKLAWFKFKKGNILQVIAADPNYERDYQSWLKQNWPSKENYLSMKKLVSQLADRPLISIIMPVYDPPVDYFEQALNSVIGQIYPHWELCMADDCSSNPRIHQIIEEYKAKDDRIKVVFRNKNGHISAASNTALSMASGEYVAFLDHDDVLTPNALYEIVKLINRQPDADLIYTDEDKLDMKGGQITPYFKPDWSPDNLLTRMYTGHLSVYRRRIVEQIGGFREGFEGSQDHDLALRFVEQTCAIFHIPKILYHWRMHTGSAALNMDVKDYASSAARTAIEQALQRRGEPGRVESLVSYSGRHSVRYDLDARDLVSIIIPTKDQSATLEKCLASLFQKSTYHNFEVLQVDNGSRDTETKKLFKRWEGAEPDRYRVIECNIPFNFAKINNVAVQQARGRYILFLNNDTEVISHDWLEGLLEQAQRKSVGAVGAKLFYPDDTVQHAGVVLGLGDIQAAGHVFQGYSESHDGYFGSSIVTSNFAALTGACLMCKKADFTDVGGFDEDLGVAYNDVDLCLKFRAKQLNNVFVPHVHLYHHESKSRGYEDTEKKRRRVSFEADILKKKWGQILSNDPYYNPNLSRKFGDFRINLN